jgi:hypothetical protein
MQDKGKKKFELLEAVSSGKVNMWGKLMEDRVILLRFVCAYPTQCKFPVSSDNSCLHLPHTREGRKNIFTKANICLVFRQRAKVESFPCVYSQLPSTPNNSHGKVAYLRVTCSDSSISLLPGGSGGSVHHWMVLTLPWQES